MKTRRKRIGRWSDLLTRQVVYEIDGALEVDDLDQFNIQRKRVFFEDVQLVTMHHVRGWPFVVTMTLLGLGILSIGIGVGARGAIITFAVIAAPFLILAALRAILGVDVVTVFGKRSRARMRYAYRRNYAARVFADLTTKVRDAQQRLAEEIRSNEPPPPSPVDADVPMPPAEDVTVPDPPPAQ